METDERERTFLKEILHMQSVVYHFCLDFNSALYLLVKKPVCVALGKLHRARVSPEEEDGKPLLSIWYLENPGKDHHKSPGQTLECLANCLKSVSTVETAIVHLCSEEAHMGL